MPGFHEKLEPIKPHTADSLTLERKKAQFPVRAMSEHIMGKEWLDRQEKALAILHAEPEIFNRDDRYFHSREQKLDLALKAERRLVELLRQGKISEDDIQMITHILDEKGPFGLHRAMFTPTLELQANEEQKEMFLTKARNYEIIGCYAQTEIGHGSNVQGLETTATFIEETDEFDIHSPTLTACKWWIGSLGIACTHAMVMARLIVRGKDYGPHPIVVPIRSTEDHRPLPGVLVGDLGPKFGFNTMDNGYVLFDHVRVPRFNLLQRFITVLRDGTVSRPPNVDPKVTYGTMVFVRSSIVENMAKELTKALTIAVRYTAVRRQFQGKTDKPTPAGNAESPVLDYSIVQFRLIPILAKNYALLATSRIFLVRYKEYIEQLNRGDFSMMKDIHATSCGLKRWSSDVCISSIDVCRHVCGGHGFSQFSGLNEFFTNVYPNKIWEGDNYLLTQQTARYLIKTLGKIRAGKPVEDTMSSRYLRTYVNSNVAKPAFAGLSVAQLAESPTAQLSLLAYRAAALADSLLKSMAKGQSWNQSLVAMPRLVDAHSDFVVASYFHEHINSLPAGSPLLPILNQLASVFFLNILSTNTGDLFRLPGVPFTADQVDEIEQALLKYIAVVREQAVPLVDALAVPDEKLGSSLGRSDGMVYEHYFNWAQNYPLNTADKGDQIRKIWWDNYIGPVVKTGSNKSGKHFSKL
ncbi:hypothetical protein EV182_001475 [Spiromyces aspiralis]|uniref:Uncharacterized protein n=1 Tax=Spiromyces aspiralis TaxID=68401 RepID=A0ACC1HTT6_9FUNG|nr:hypothetical protein EV182_001475 [Spiromyces aspiralis]